MIRTDYIFGNSKCKVLALAIHNGHNMPDKLLENCGIDEASRLREEDPHTGTIASLFENHIIVHDSRFMIDLNRVIQDSVYQEPDDCWGLKARKNPLSLDYLFELHSMHKAWYDVLKYQLDRILLFQPQILILDLHSYNHHRLGPDKPEDDPLLNPDIILGRSNLHPMHYPLIEKLRSRLDGLTWQGKTLDCRCDVKFSGGYLSRWINSTYPNRAICLAIEFKKIWMDEWSGKVYEPGFSELKALFKEQFSDFCKADLSGRFS